MSNNLAIKVTTDIVDAQAKLSVLNADLRATERQINSLARAGAAGSLDAAGAQQLQSLTAHALELKSEMQPLAVTVADAGFAVRGFGAAAVQAGENAAMFTVHSASMARYGRELFDVFSTGRTRYLPSILAEIAQQGLGMSGALLGGVAAAAALTAGLGYLAYRAIEAKEGLQNLTMVAQRTGNLDLSVSAIQRFIDTSSSAANVSRKDAEAIGSALASIPNMAQPTFDALSHLMSGWITETGDKPEQIAKEWQKIFSGSAEAAAAANHLSQAEIDAARAADQSGNAYKVQASQLQTLVTVYERAANTAAQKASGLGTGSFLQDFKNLGSYIYGGNDVLGSNGQVEMQTAYQRLLTENTAAMRSNVAAIKERITALGEMSEGPEQKLRQGMDLVSKIDPDIVQIQKLKSEIDELTQARGAAKTPQQIEAIDESIKKLQGDLAKLQGGGKSVDLGAALSGLSGRVGDELLQHQQEIANQLPALMERAQQEQDAIQQEGLQSTLEILQMRADYVRNTLDQEVSAGRMSAAQRAAIEKELTQTLAAEDIKRLQDELATLTPGTIEYQRVADQIAQIKAREGIEIQEINNKEAQSTAQAAQKQAQAWQKALAPISGAISTSINGIIQGTQTAQQAVAKMLESIVEKYIAAGVKATVNWVAQEAQKTAATMAGESARTSAAVAGNAARTAAVTSAAAAQRTVSATTGAKTVMSDAARAFSGTYASVAQIPYVGWILAPAAASAAFAAVAGYEGLASLDVGAFNVPQDMVAQIHQGEMVVPKTFAEGLRQNGGMAAGGGSVSHNYGGVHVSAIDGPSVRRFFGSRANQGIVASAAMAYVRRGGR